MPSFSLIEPSEPSPTMPPPLPRTHKVAEAREEPTTRPTTTAHAPASTRGPAAAPTAQPPTTDQLQQRISALQSKLHASVETYQSL